MDHDGAWPVTCYATGLVVVRTGERVRIWVRFLESLCGRCMLQSSCFTKPIILAWVRETARPQHNGKGFFSMAGKPITKASDRVAWALSQVSKNTLADMVLQVVLKEVGKDASDLQILARVQKWLDPVQRSRGDTPIDLIGVLQRKDRYEARMNGWSE